MGFFQKLSRYVDDVLLLPDDARALVEVAQRHLDAGAAAEALDAASKALELRRDHPQILWVAAEALLRLGETAQGESMLREALEIDPDHALSRVTLGRLLLAQGHAEEAAAELRRAVPRLAGDADAGAAAKALFELSRCHVALNRPDRAARELRKAIALGADDVELHLALAKVLLEAGDEVGAARAAARRAAEIAAGREDPALSRRAGEVLLEAGLEDEAEGLLLRALAGGEAVHLALAKVAVARGDAVTAHEHALRALADSPGDAEPHRLRARLALRAGDYAGAASALEAAVAADPDDIETLRLALRTVARLDLARASSLADALLHKVEDDPLALAVRARADIATGRLDRARAALDELAQRAPEVTDLWLGRAELAIGEGDGEAALAALERAEAVEAGRPEIESLGEAACRLVASAGSAGEPDLFDVLERVHGLLAASPTLSELSVEVGRIREDYDKPLLLTVMGEFNAGKSTFINALVGEPVAPMGITPTTATINVLKYGPEKKVRVLHRTGVVKELEYEALAGWLKGLSREAAVEVRQVEILYPAEELMRVNLVDTPGFNSIVAEHELVAQSFIERADAVVWLFDAGQPGKESEREALSRVAARGKRVLGVLNKADRLEPEALARVLEHLEAEELQGLVEGAVPLSARRALQAKSGDAPDHAALAESGLPDLERRLDEEFYSKARLIKRAGCAERLVTLLERAVAAETAASAELRRAVTAVDAATTEASTLAEPVVTAASELVAGEIEALWGDVARLAAREILEFVRPRRHLLDSHRFSDEDRRYLVELIEDRLSAAMQELVEPLADRVEEAVEGLWAELRELDEEVVATPLDARHEAEELAQAVTWSMLAFQRGLVLGGKAERFLDDELPHLELEEQEIAQRILHWWLGHEGQLRGELAHGAELMARRLGQRLGGEAARLRAELARRRRTGVRPLSGFAALAKDWVRFP